MHVTMHITLCFAVLWSLAKHKSGIPLNFLARVPYKFFSPFFTIIIIIFFPGGRFPSLLFIRNTFPPAPPPPLLALSIRERDYTIVLSGGTIEQSGKTKYTCTHGGIDEVCTCCVVAKRDRRDQSLIFLALVYRIKGRKIFGFIFMLPLIYTQKFEYRPSRDEREKNIRRWIIFLI